MTKLNSGISEGAMEFWRSVFLSAIRGRAYVCGSKEMVECASEIADKAVEDAIKRGAVRSL